MPITIIEPGRGVLTPGLQITGFTDFVGPLLLDDQWWISLVDQATEEVQIQQRFPTNGIKDLAVTWLDPSVPQIEANSPRYMDGGAGRLLVELRHANGALLESASVAVKYDTTTGIPELLQLQALKPQPLPELQVEQIAETNKASAVDELTDSLTLTELTSGPTGQPLNVHLTSVTFGVIVRLVNIPDELVPQTPDNQYWSKTLATVRVFRGNDLWIRAPIHTPTRIVSFEKEGITIWVANATLTQWLLNIRVLVDFLPGVTGQVFQMHFP